MSSQALRTLVTEKIDVRWNEWAARHPHLADAIDRVHMVESTVQRLQNDPAYVAAMREADLDETRLIHAARLLQRIEDFIGHVLPS